MLLNLFSKENLTLKPKWCFPTFDHIPASFHPMRTQIASRILAAPSSSRFISGTRRPLLLAGRSPLIGGGAGTQKMSTMASHDHSDHGHHHEPHHPRASKEHSDAFWLIGSIVVFGPVFFYLTTHDQPAHDHAHAEHHRRGDLLPLSHEITDALDKSKGRH